MKSRLFFIAILFCLFPSFGEEHQIFIRHINSYDVSITYEGNSNNCYFSEQSSNSGTLYVRDDKYVVKFDKSKNTDSGIDFNFSHINDVYTLQERTRSGNSYGSYHTIYTLTVIEDTDNPSYDVCLYLDSDFKEKIDENTWTNKDVYLRLENLKDDTSSIDYKKIKITNKNDTVNYNLSYIKISESCTAEITVYDLVGNNTTKSIDVKIDKDAPEIKFTDINGNKIGDKWTNISKIFFSDKNIKSNTEFFLNSIKIDSPHTFSTGINEITAKDEAGNVSTKSLCIDTIKPSINCTKLEYSKENNKIKNLYCVFSFADDDSGVFKCSKEDKGESNIDRTETKKFELDGYVEDNAGNISYMNWNTSPFGSCGNINGDKLEITLPPYVKIRNHKSKIKDANLKTTFVLDNCNEDFINKNKNIQIKRIFYVPGDNGKKEPLNRDNFTKYFDESLKEQWERLTELSNIAIKSGETSYKFTDSIPVKSGFTHMGIGYILCWETKDLSTKEESEEYYVKPTVDTQARINLRVKGKNSEYLYMKIINNKVSYEPNEKFEIPSNGCIQIEYKINNPDSEPYEIEFREIVKLPQNEDFISIGMEGFSQRGAMENCKVYTYRDTEGNNNIYQRNSWNTFNTPIYLYFNKPTNFVIYTKEGFLYSEENSSTYGQEAYMSEIIQFKAEPKNLGGFKLVVGEEAGYNDKGITAKPFQSVEMYLSSELNNEISWDFGDNTISKEPKVSHKWSQSDSRIDDTSNYTLTITHGNTSAQIPVFIVDTQYGKMYGNEVWRGKHKILSTINIVDSQKLTIGDYKNLETEILCVGDLSESYKGGIIIEKGASLLIQNGERVKFIECRNDSKGYVPQEKMIYGWKGITISGEADLTNVDFFYADRALSLLSQGILKIKNSNLIENKIGLHMLEASKAELSDVQIHNNYEYGIKQDKENSLVIKNSLINGNTIDWYDYIDTELTEDEINSRIREYEKIK